MTVNARDIKTLRERTGLGFLACRHALEAARGDMDQALAELRKESAKVAAKKSGRSLGAGIVHAYVHATRKVGALVELRSETDFVAKREDFNDLAHDVAMHVAATDPEDVETLLKEEHIKDPARTVRQRIEEATQKFGERVEVARFARFDVS